MKKIVLTAMIAAFSFTAIQAQDVVATKAEAKKSKEEHHAHFQKALAGLNLSEEQRTKIKTLQEAHQQQMEEVKKEGISQDKIEAIRKEQHEQLLSVLTDSQKTELEKVKTEGKLEKAKTSGSKEELIAKLKAIQQDANLTEEQKRLKSKEILNSAKAGVSDEDLQKISDKFSHDLKKKPSPAKATN